MGTLIKTPFVPPGGFMGFAQQTPATHALLSRRSGTTRTTRRKKTAAKKKSGSRSSTRTRTASKKRSKKKARRLVAGTPEAKRHMKRLRGMQKKR